MCAVQLLRVSVHERISAAAEDFLLQLEKGEETAQVPALRALLTERLTAAAKEIAAVFEETVAEYEDRLERSEREICRQRRLLDAVMKPEIRLHRAGQSLLPGAGKLAELVELKCSLVAKLMELSCFLVAKLTELSCSLVAKLTELSCSLVAKLTELSCSLVAKLTELSCSLVVSCSFCLSYEKSRSRLVQSSIY